MAKGTTTKFNVKFPLGVIRHLQGGSDFAHHFHNHHDNQSDVFIQKLPELPTRSATNKWYEVRKSGIPLAIFNIPRVLATPTIYKGILKLKMP